MISIKNTVKAFIVRLFFKKIDYKSIIFSSSFNSSFDYNSKYLFEYFLKNAPEFNCYYVMNDKFKRAELSEIYGEEHFIDTSTYQGALTALSSGIWVTSAGLPVYVPFAGKIRKILNVWHGMPLKKIGKSENNSSFSVKMKQHLFFSYNYTSISVTSDFFIPFFIEAFSVEKSIINVLGEPRDDMMNNKIDKFQYLKKWNFIDLDSNSKLILYAPTFRDSKKTNYFPFEDYDNEIINDWLKSNNVFIIIRPHKSEKELVSEHLNTNILLLDQKIQEDIAECLNLFDLLITDYSSILFSYLLTNNPAIFFPYDLKEYTKDRGLYFAYEDYAVGPCPSTSAEMIHEIKTLLNDELYYQTARHNAKKKYCFSDSNSCKKHYEYILKISSERLNHV